MSQEQWTAVDHYLEGLLVERDVVLDNALEASLAQLVRSGQVTREQAARVANDRTALASYLHE